MVYEIFITIVLLYLTQCCLCAIVHVINGSEKTPTTLKEYVLQFLNIFWVMFNLKKLRD
jgi:hypothetical protein